MHGEGQAPGGVDAVRVATGAPLAHKPPRRRSHEAARKPVSTPSLSATLSEKGPGEASAPACTRRRRRPHPRGAQGDGNGDLRMGARSWPSPTRAVQAPGRGGGRGRASSRRRGGARKRRARRGLPFCCPISYELLNLVRLVPRPPLHRQGAGTMTYRSVPKEDAGVEEGGGHAGHGVGRLRLKIPEKPRRALPLRALRYARNDDAVRWARRAEETSQAI